MAVSDLLNVSRLGIFASQGSLQAISHNIANVNTPGYSRQAVTLESSPGSKVIGLGGGVQISDYTRQFDKLVDRRQELGTGELGRLETRERYLTLIEDVFNDMDGDGLSQRLDEFFAAADSLADNPSNPVAREELVTQADAMTRYIQDMHQSLSDMAMPVDNEIDVQIEEINTRLQAIQEVNALIITSENTNPALDLKDQRRNLVLELGKLIDIQTVDTQRGGIQVMTSAGQVVLADSVYAATLERSAPAEGEAFLGIQINGKEFDLDTIRGGALRGLLEIRDEVINGSNGYLTKLNTLANEIRFQVNQVHTQAANRDLYTSQTGVFDLELGLVKDNDTDKSIATLQTELAASLSTVLSTNADTQRLPRDLDRVVDGEIVFASGASVDALTNISRVGITTDMTLREVRDAINASEAVEASIDNNRLTISAPSGNVYGVVSDSSNILAALGVGALIGGGGSRDIAVNPTHLADNRLAAVGRLQLDDAANPTAAIHEDLNNEAALALGNLRTTKVDLFDQNLTLTAHYGTLVGNLGSQFNLTKDSLKSQEVSHEFVSNLRESVSGVSLEEELTDLVRFQRAFQASSKMVTVADELMTSIIRMV